MAKPVLSLEWRHVLAAALLDPEVIPAKMQVAAGGALLTTPFWLQAVQAVSMVAGMVAAVAGAIIGIHGVWKIVQGRKDKDANEGGEANGR